MQVILELERHSEIEVGMELFLTVSPTGPPLDGREVLMSPMHESRQQILDQQVCLSNWLEFLLVY